MSLPSLVPDPLTDKPTMALETPPIVVAMLHQDKNVRSLAAGINSMQSELQASSRYQSAIKCYQKTLQALAALLAVSMQLGLPDAPAVWPAAVATADATKRGCSTHQNNSWAQRAWAPCAAAAARLQVYDTGCQKECRTPVLSCPPW